MIIHIPDDATEEEVAEMAAEAREIRELAAGHER